MFWFTLNGLLNQAVLRIGKPIKINNNLQTPFCSTYLTYFELAQCIKAKQSSCTLSLLPNLYSCVKCSGNWEVSKSKLLFLILLTLDKNVSTVFILMHTASPNDSADEGNKVRGLGFEVVRRASRHMILFFLPTFYTTPLGGSVVLWKPMLSHQGEDWAYHCSYLGHLGHSSPAFS